MRRSILARARGEVVICDEGLRGDALASTVRCILFDLCIEWKLTCDFSALIEMAERAKRGTTLGQSTSNKVSRTALPFIPAHDLPRGLVTSMLALLGFLFMLAVMYVFF